MWIISDAFGIKAEARGDGRKNNGREMQIDSALISIWSPLIVEACDCVFYLRYRRSDTAANHLSTWALKTLNTVWFNLIYHSIMHLSIILLLGAFDVYRQNAFTVDWDKETNGGTSFLTIGARFKGLSSLGRVVVWKCFVFEWQGKKKQCVLSWKVSFFPS